MTKPFLEINNDRACIYIDEMFYSKTAILKAAYNYTDKCYVLFTQTDNKLLVTLTKLDNNVDNETSINEIAQLFCNELLEQMMREQIISETGSLREIITARAFASGGFDISKD